MFESYHENDFTAFSLKGSKQAHEKKMVLVLLTRKKDRSINQVLAGVEQKQSILLLPCMLHTSSPT